MNQLTREKINYRLSTKLKKSPLEQQKYLKDLTEAVAKGSLTKSENSSSIDLPNSFCMVP
jgi:hypothetical protein